jgi:hypothetical protein
MKIAWVLLTDSFHCLVQDAMVGLALHSGSHVVAPAAGPALLPVLSDPGIISCVPRRHMPMFRSCFAVRGLAIEAGLQFERLGVTYRLTLTASRFLSFVRC